MEFNQRNLHPLTYTNGFTLWHYKAPSETVLSILDTPGYFNRAMSELRHGDAVLLQCKDGTDYATVHIADDEVRIMSSDMGFAETLGQVISQLNLLQMNFNQLVLLYDAQHPGALTPTPPPDVVLN